MPGQGEECVSKAWQAGWSFIGSVLTQIFLARHYWAALGYLMCAIHSLLPSAGCTCWEELPTPGWGEHHPSLCLLQSLVSQDPGLGETFKIKSSSPAQLSGTHDEFSVLTWEDFGISLPSQVQGVLCLCWAAVSDALCPLPVTNTGSHPTETHSWEHIFLHLHGDKG